MIRLVQPLALAVAAGFAAAASGAETDPDLAPYYGFEAPRFVVIDQGFELADVADVTGDGLLDLIVINNRKSRIEIHSCRPEPREPRGDLPVNRFGESRWYDRRDVTVTQQVQAVKAVDLDGDGRFDLVYAGQPEAIVTMRQTESGDFEPLSRRRVRGIGATRSAFSIADVSGDRSPEIVTLADGRVAVLPLGENGVIGVPTFYGSGEAIAAVYTVDATGDGHADIVGVSPESKTPVRVWMQERAGDRGALGAERRFETPPLRELDPARLPTMDAAALAMIERPTRRVVLQQLVQERVDLRSGGSATEAPMEIRSLANPGRDRRATVVADLDADGLLDVLATDPAGNRVELWRQRRGTGLAASESFSSFKSPSAIAVGQWNDEPRLEVFVVSEEENVVGVSELVGVGDSLRLTFPTPIALQTTGGTPTAVAATEHRGEALLAIAVKDRRDVKIEIHTPDGVLGVMEAKGLRRAPEALRWADVDQDGDPDVLVLGSGGSLVMIRSDDTGAPEASLGDDEMLQFGLVSAAGAGNTALLDATGDGLAELFVADENFVRALRYDAERGWVVVEQITDPDAAARYVGVDVARDRSKPGLIVADAASGRLKMYERANGDWEMTGSAGVAGFELGAIHAGSFDGAGGPGVLATGPDAFAHALLSGERWALRDLGSYRSDDDDRLEHEIAVGDVNGDGYTDLVVLDAQRQMVQILAVTTSGELLPATEFQAFETRSFGFDRARGFEPRNAVIADATGDGAPDLILVVHDRLVIHPQATR